MVVAMHLACMSLVRIANTKTKRIMGTFIYIFISFAPGSKVLEFLIEWKVLIA